MAQTLVEKILGEAIGRRVHAGDTVVAPVHRALMHDGTAPGVLQRLEKLDPEELALRATTTIYVDHGAAASTPEVATWQRELRATAAQWGLGITDAGQGISHQLMVEEQACPGEVIVGADSHTCMAGALGAFALGMGSTDVACAVARGETWLPVPASILVDLAGAAFRPGVSAKDLMLSLIGRLGAMGANGAALEFGGAGVEALDMESRFVLANLAAEVGATTGLLPSDLVTRDYLQARGRPEAFAAIGIDTDAAYARHLKLDPSRQEPVVARPGHHDDVASVEDLEDEAVDQVVIGSCTNGRLSDFQAAADILAGRRIDPRVTLLLVPASRRVMEEAFAAGVMPTLLEAGGTLVTPGCGPCVGIHQGVLGPKQVCVATQSRNFPGRMGDRTARIYLASPYTAAASALRGRLTDPREVLDGA